jgi:hypothetical protein
MISTYEFISSIQINPSHPKNYTILYEIYEHIEKGRGISSRQSLKKPVIYGREEIQVYINLLTGAVQDTTGEQTGRGNGSLS